MIFTVVIADKFGMNPTKLYKLQPQGENEQESVEVLTQRAECSAMVAYVLETKCTWIPEAFDVQTSMALPI